MFIAYMGNGYFEMVPDQEIFDFKKGYFLKQNRTDRSILLVFDGLECIGWIPASIVNNHSSNQQHYC